MLIKKPKLLDPANPNKSTSVINGLSSGILNWDDIKYKQIYEIYKKLLGNFWTPFEVNMAKDAKDYKLLTEDEREAFRNIIGLLSILDSVQPKFLALVTEFLTDDSISACLIIMAQQEVVHNHSYSYVLSSVEQKNMQDIAFQAARTNPLVYERNKIITDLYDEAFEKRTFESLLKALTASIILEGINFYSGFAFFYNLGRNQKMMATATMIQYINRDEMSHTHLVSQIIKLLVLENPEVMKEFDFENFVKDLFKEAVELEIVWSKYALRNIEDIDLDEMSDYIKYRANKCLSMINIEPIFEGLEKNPMLWINAYLNEGETKGLTKTDFFEQKSREYAKVSENNGFDDL